MARFKAVGGKLVEAVGDIGEQLAEKVVAKYGGPKIDLKTGKSVPTAAPVTKSEPVPYGGKKISLAEEKAKAKASDNEALYEESRDLGSARSAAKSSEDAVDKNAARHRNLESMAKPVAAGGALAGISAAADTDVDDGLTFPEDADVTRRDASEAHGGTMKHRLIKKGQQWYVEYPDGKRHPISEESAVRMRDTLKAVQGSSGDHSWNVVGQRKTNYGSAHDAMLREAKHIRETAGNDNAALSRADDLEERAAAIRAERNDGVPVL